MKHQKSTVKLSLFAILLTACGCAGNGLVQLPPGLPFNFYAIEEGRAYRSAQPSAESLASVVANYGIRTVINLRGENPGEGWYDEEFAACQQLNVTLRSYPMSARSLPASDLLEQITDALQTAEYPILIHCQDGADRSGAISAIYRILIKGEDKSAAMSELSPLYFHFRELKPCMDTLVENYEPTAEWLAQYEQTWNELTCKP